MPTMMVEKTNGLLKKAGATHRWLNVVNTAQYRETNEKRLTPVIQASGAKVE
jgi:hypothetical protein